MSKEEKVVISNLNQPLKASFPNIDAAVTETLKNSALYKNAAKIHTKDELENKLMITESVTTNGWDTMSICRISALNKRIKEKKTYPSDIRVSESQTIGQLQIDVELDGTFGAWQIVPGGDGKNIRLRLPLENGDYKGLGASFQLKDIAVEIYVTLNYLPQPDAERIKDGNYELYVNTNPLASTTPIAAVTNLDDPSGILDDFNKSILKDLFSKWLNKAENLKSFNTLFSTVIINNMGEKSEEFQWLRATSIGYAYTDGPTEDSSIFGVLCMTKERSSVGLPNQLPAVRLENENNAVFLINRVIFVKYQLLPALPMVFEESEEATFEADEAGTKITAKNVKIEKVKVGAINYQPIAEEFTITFNETDVHTRVKTHTEISPGIDAYTIIETDQTFKLDYNKDKEPIMVYEMIGGPSTNSYTETAVGIIITEVILGVIAAVATGIAGYLGNKLLALIVGIITALVVATVSIAIHVIMEKVIAEGIYEKMPSVDPMVKVLSQQVKWPFCEEDAFVLDDIDYLGALIFRGNLAVA